MLTPSEERTSPVVIDDIINDGKSNMYFDLGQCFVQNCETESYSLLYIVPCYGNDMISGRTMFIARKKYMKK